MEGEPKALSWHRKSRLSRPKADPSRSGALAQHRGRERLDVATCHGVAFRSYNLRVVLDRALTHDAQLKARTVGIDDAHALLVAVSPLSAFELMGLPEGTLPMTHAAMYNTAIPTSRSTPKFSMGPAHSIFAHRGHRPIFRYRQSIGAWAAYFHIFG